MTITRATRTLLALISAAIVVWSFYDVGRRAWIRHELEKQRPITLTILHWGNAAESNVVQKLVDRYEAEHPRIRIVRIHAPGGSGDMENKLKTMFAAGTPPDLFYLPPDELPELAEMKLIRPIDDYIEKERRAGTAGWMDDIYPILLKAWHYNVKTQTVGTGKLYGLPKDFTTAGFYVNLDLFKAAGVKVPFDGWSWNDFERDCKKITELTGKPGFEGRKIYGGFLQLWSDSLRNVIWTYGGDFFRHRPDGSVDFRDVTLDEPPAQQAMDMIVRTRLRDHTVYNAAGIAKDGGQEFINGNIGCIGPIGRWMVPTFKSITAFHWDFVPVPYLKKQYQASRIYYTAWAMAAASKHPDESYKLMKFLCGPEGAVMQSELGLAIPPLKSVANSKAFLDPPGIPKHHAQIFLDAIQYARLQQTPPEQEWKRIVDDKSKSALQLGEVSPMTDAKMIQSAWLAELNSPLRAREWPAMRWDWVLAITGAVCAILLALLWWRARRERLGPLDRAQARAGYWFIMPWLIGFLALALGPMIASLLLSFTSWSAMTPIVNARAVGSANYRQLFTADPAFWQSIKVTLYYVVLVVPIGQIAALGVALLVNLRLRGITLFRTIYFVPTVISGVALAVLWLQIFNNDYGILNQITNGIFRGLYDIVSRRPGVTIIAAFLFFWVAGLTVLWRMWFSNPMWHGRPARDLALPGYPENMGEAPMPRGDQRVSRMLFGSVLLIVLIALLAIGFVELLGILGYGVSAPDWFGVDAKIWAVPAFVIMGLWGVGGGMIIYLAGLKGIPMTLYEAATIDGASPARRLWNVTLPMLSPLIFYNVVMALIGSFQVFTQAYVMTDGGPDNATLFYVLYLYRQAFEFHNMGYASAMAWILFLIVLGLTILVFRASKNLVYYEGLKA